MIMQRQVEAKGKNATSESSAVIVKFQTKFSIA